MLKTINGILIQGAWTTQRALQKYINW